MNPQSENIVQNSEEIGMAIKIDALDRKILRLLQEDATPGLDEIAARVGSSKTPVWNRIRKLRDAGGYGMIRTVRGIGYAVKG